MTLQTLERPEIAQTHKKAQLRTPNGAVPPLESGDHLTRAEFERAKSSLASGSTRLPTGPVI